MMELVRIDTKRAYDLIRERITTLDLEPGSVINEQQLAEALDMGLVPVREALKLLAHENLVIITPRHGLYVADVNIPDLEQLSEMRLALEGLSARLAAQRAVPDDIIVLEALRREQANTWPIRWKGSLDYHSGSGTWLCPGSAFCQGRSKNI
jgi:DNA-binding GntR family transcriptional regulator